MKIYCITESSDLEIGLKLAGCEGITINEDEKIERQIDLVLQNKEIGILVISRGIYEKARDRIDSIKLNRKLPLVTII